MSDATSPPPPRSGDRLALPAPTDVEPDPRVTRRTLSTAFAVGMMAAIVVPDHQIGLGVALSALAAVSAVLVGRPVASWLSPWRGAALASVVLATALPAVSDAEWVVVPALFGITIVAVVALGGSRSWPGLLLPLPRCVPLGLRSVAAINRELLRLAPAGDRLRPVIRAMLLTAALIAIFGALFASADRLFGTLVERFLLPDIDAELPLARLVVLVAVTTGVVTLVRLRPRTVDDQRPGEPARLLEGVEWQVPLIGLLVLFAGFVTIQFGVLFGGHERVLRTAGLTYAEYARGGFAQLVVVAMLTLAVIATAARYARTRDDRQARLRRWLLAGLCLLTLVVLASAFHRLALYQDAFGFTRLRFGAQAIIWWLAAVFALVLIAGGARRTAWLPRTVVLLTAVAVVGVGYLQPDAFIARWNVDRYAAEGTIDVHYLSGLSADALPALMELPDGLRDCVVARHVRRPADAEAVDGWAAWNRSRARADAALAALPEGRTCDPDVLVSSQPGR